VSDSVTSNETPVRNRFRWHAPGTLFVYT